MVRPRKSVILSERHENTLQTTSSVVPRNAHEETSSESYEVTVYRQRRQKRVRGADSAPTQEIDKHTTKESTYLTDEELNEVGRRNARTYWTESLQQLIQDQIYSQIRMSKFSGAKNEDFDLWLYEFDAVVQRFALDDVRALHLFRDSLKGEALSTFISLPKDWIPTLREAKELMSELYSNKVSPFEWRAELRKTKMLLDEGFRQFAQRIRKLVLKAYPNLTKEVYEDYTLDYFINGVHKNIRRRLQVRNLTSIESAVAKAIIYDAENKAVSSESCNESEEIVMEESNKRKRQHEDSWKKTQLNFTTENDAQQGAYGKRPYSKEATNRAYPQVYSIDQQRFSQQLSHPQSSIIHPMSSSWSSMAFHGR